MISQLSSRPSRLRQPSLSGWLRPDISTPRKGVEDDANNVAPLGPKGRRLGNRHRKCFSCSSPPKSLGILDRWAEVVAKELSQETRCSNLSFRAGQDRVESHGSHFREGPRLHREHRPSTREMVAGSETLNSSGVPPPKEHSGGLRSCRCVESGRRPPGYGELP